MKLEFKEARKKVWSVDLNLNLSYENIVKEFESEDWIFREKKDTGRRDYVQNIKSPILKQIYDYAVSDQAKIDLINNFYTFKGIEHLYGGLSADEMFKRTKLRGRFHKCMKGYELGPHLDHRLHIGTMIFYFTNGDIPEWSTYYYTTENKKDEYRMPTGLGKGTCHINDYDTWHYACNFFEEPRYNLIIGLFL